MGIKGGLRFDKVYSALRWKLRAIVWRVIEMFKIVSAHEGDRLEDARALFVEYANGLGIDLCLQGFDEELRTLPGRYSPPRGRLLIAVSGDTAAGCVALREIEAGVCEMKRLYARPAFRGNGLGRLLAEAIVREGRAIGYRRMVLDTLQTMAAARGLYRSLGFRVIEPYGHHPYAGTEYLGLDLQETVK